MAAGSGFDAFVKNRIYRDVFGETAVKGTPYEMPQIFEAQVEEHIRDEVYAMSAHLFDYYVNCGAYAALLAEIMKSPSEPQMEFTVKAVVNGIPILGKPDLYYFTPEMVKVICDFKINGSFSKWGVSPVQGFQSSRYFKKNELIVEKHKKYVPITYKDLEVNETGLENFSEDWATQLSLYAWCLGEEPGDENYVVRMEQMACRPNKKAGGLNIKVATHMSRISARFQYNVMRRLMDCWSNIEAGHIFTDRTLEESQEHCEMLDLKFQTPLGLHPVMNQYLTEKNPRFK